MKTPINGRPAGEVRRALLQAAVAIEHFTQGQVTRQDLFPNDWQQIWPELAQPAATSN